MGRLDDIERRVPHCTDSKDLDTLLRLARLAERAATSVRDGGPFMNTDPEWAKEAWRILHPAPAKGHVAWFRNCEPAFSSHLADGVTLDEAKAAFAPTPPVAPQQAKDAEIDRLKQRVQAEEMVAYSLSRDRERLWRALEIIIQIVEGDTRGTSNPVVMQIARDALDGKGE